MNLEELINKYGPDGTIPLFVQGNGHFSGPDGIKGKWKDYEKDQSKTTKNKEKSQERREEIVETIKNE